MESISSNATKEEEMEARRKIVQNRDWLPSFSAQAIMRMVKEYDEEEFLTLAEPYINHLMGTETAGRNTVFIRNILEKHNYGFIKLPESLITKFNRYIKEQVTVIVEDAEGNKRPKPVPVVDLNNHEDISTRIQEIINAELSKSSSASKRTL